MGPENDSRSVGVPDGYVPDSLRAALRVRSRSARARKGQFILSEGAPSTDVYFIVSGMVQFSLISSLGRETILRNMSDGQLFGELAAIDGQPRSVNAIALKDSELAVLTAADFRGFIGDVPAAGLWIAELLAARVRDLTAKTFELATMPVANRLQGELLRMCDAVGKWDVGGDGCDIDNFPIHAELAARIGTHREAVSRELSQLAQEGVIAQQGRTLRIFSVIRLRAIYVRTAR
jgi:CRP/FNR family transcriptional regulator, cyclic AMP receptor protein